MVLAEFPENLAHDAPVAQQRPQALQGEAPLVPCSDRVLVHGVVADTLKSLSASLAVMRKTMDEERPTGRVLVDDLLQIASNIQDMLTDQREEQFVKVGQRTLNRRSISRSVEHVKEVRLDVWMQDGEVLTFKGTEALKLRAYLEHHSLDIVHWPPENG